MVRRLDALDPGTGQIGAANACGEGGRGSRVMALVAAIAALSAAACGDDAANKNVAGCPDGQLTSDGDCFQSGDNNNSEPIMPITCGEGTQLMDNQCVAVPQEREGACENVEYCPEGFVESGGKFVEENPLDPTQKNTVCVPQIFGQICEEGAAAQCDLPECEDAREVCSAVPVVPDHALLVDVFYDLPRQPLAESGWGVKITRTEMEGGLPVCEKPFSTCSNVGICDDFELPMTVENGTLPIGLSCDELQSRAVQTLARFGLTLVRDLPCSDVTGYFANFKVHCTVAGHDGLPRDAVITVPDDSGIYFVTVTTPKETTRILPVCHQSPE